MVTALCQAGLVLLVNGRPAIVKRRIDLSNFLQVPVMMEARLGAGAVVRESRRQEVGRALVETDAAQVGVAAVGRRAGRVRVKSRARSRSGSVVESGIRAASSQARSTRRRVRRKKLRVGRKPPKLPGIKL